MEETSFLQQIKLAVDLLRLGLPKAHDVGDDEALVQIEEAIKLIGSCMNKQGHGEQGAKASEEVAQILSSCGTAKVFFDLMYDLRQCMSKKTWSCIMALRTACITLTGTFDSFCLDLYSAGFMVILMKELKIYSKVCLEQNVCYHR